jgi:hypothetical protein
MAAFGAVSFQEGKESDWARAAGGVRAIVSVTTMAHAAVWISRDTNMGFPPQF